MASEDLAPYDVALSGEETTAVQVLMTPAEARWLTWLAEQLNAHAPWPAPEMTVSPSKARDAKGSPARRPRNGARMGCGCWYEVRAGAQEMDTRATCPRHGDTWMDRVNVDEPGPLAPGELATDWIPANKEGDNDGE